MGDGRSSMLTPRDIGTVNGAASQPRIQQSVTDPVRVGLSWHQLWEGSDSGLIAAWERGRAKASEADGSDLAKCALAGELVILPWKGGAPQFVKGGRIGSLLYLAMWQGLRGDDLDVSLNCETTKVCSATGTTVTFSPDARKVASA
jgi:hypothetical protein